jgi:CubicO group peptidase (beta-lactamase class C family)
VKLLAALLLLCGCGGSPPLDGAFAAAVQIPNVRSLRVEQHGVVVREQYWGGGDADTPHDVRSVTKSVMSLLAGIADRQGCLPLDATLGATLGPEGLPIRRRRPSPCASCSACPAASSGTSWATSTSTTTG